MSNYYACGGYLLELTEDVIEILGITKKRLCDQFRHNTNIDTVGWDSGDYDIEDILGEIASVHAQIDIELNGVTVHPTVFYYDSDDHSSHDEIENRTYLRLEPGDLYLETPTRFNNILKDKNIEVPFYNWVSCG